MPIKKRRLTDDKLKNEPAPTGAPQWYKDTKLPGFKACLFKSGSIAFYCQKDRKGKTHSVALGKNIKAHEAEAAYYQAIADIVSGYTTNPMSQIQNSSPVAKLVTPS